MQNPGQVALDQALALWAEGIFDPWRGATSEAAVQARGRIQGFISHGLWWGDVYTGDGDFEWCGAFAAACWGVAGLKLEVRKDWFASTYRLNNYAAYRPLVFPKRTVPNPRPLVGPWRLRVDLNDVAHAATLADKRHTLPLVLPGDILLVGDKRGYGSHITLVESFDPKTGVFKTVSGNGVGALGPARVRGQGVVKKNYTLGKGPRVLIRPSSTDLIPGV